MVNQTTLKQKASLTDYQQLIAGLVVERGFDKETVHEVEEEAADVFWLLVDLCNRLNIDLAKAFEDKERKNKQRQWSADS